MASGDDILNLMVKYLGTPYVWGGESPSGFDCSGLMQYVFGQAGVKIPRTAATQAAGPGQRVDPKDMRPGDLMFFDFSKQRAGIDHVAIYIGNGMMIEAPRPGESVHVTKVYATPVQVSRYATAGIGTNTATQKYANGTIYPATTGGPVAGVTSSPDKLDINQLAATYGWDAAFLKSSPELQNLFTQAINDPQGQWTPAKFQAMLQQTQWWKTHSQSVAQAIDQKFKDPATYAANVAQKQADIVALASSMGAALDPAALAKLADRAYQTGMDEAQLKSALSGFIVYSKSGTLGGDAGSVADQLRANALANGLKISDSYILNAARGVEGGTSSIEQEMQGLRSMAASAFPQWKTQIEAGQNLSDIASPYVQSMASTLEIDPSSIDLFDPTIRKALQGTPDAKTGEPTAQGLWSFENGLKQDPRWMQTDNARESLMGVTHGVLSSLGLES